MEPSRQFDPAGLKKYPGVYEDYGSGPTPAYAPGRSVGEPLRVEEPSTFWKIHKVSGEIGPPLILMALFLASHNEGDASAQANRAMGTLQRGRAMLNSAWVQMPRLGDFTVGVLSPEGAPYFSMPMAMMARKAEGEAARIVVTEEKIREAMKDAPLRTDQSGISLPAVQRYVLKLEKGLVAPSIQVADGVIVDGNHRYVAGRVFGKEPAQTPWVRPSHKTGPGLSWDQVFVDAEDWGNK